MIDVSNPYNESQKNQQKEKTFDAVYMVGTWNFTSNVVLLGQIDVVAHRHEELMRVVHRLDFMWKVPRCVPFRYDEGVREI